MQLAAARATSKRNHLQGTTNFETHQQPDL